MRLKNIPGSRERIAESKYLIKELPAAGVAFVDDDRQTGRHVLGAWSVKGHWHEVFGNSNPIHIEIGMGKGTFLMEHARRQPGINFVGIEKYSSVILRAVQKQDEEELPNIRFLRMDAEYINDVFAENEVAKIYLNFSDPWPKARHAKRRLTSTDFLARYKKLLADADTAEMGQLHEDAIISDAAATTQTGNIPKCGIVEFKTDNVSLFDFSLEEAAIAGWPLLICTRDLHHDAALNEENIMTEYEAKFSAAGQKICKMIIKKP